MSRVRIVVVSDSHLSPQRAAAEQNWSAVVDHIDASQPDLVVHLGDVSMNGADDEEDLSYARDQMDRLSGPWRAIPGNHDIGDVPSAAIEPDEIVTGDRVQRWLDHFGADRWVIDIGGWRLVGVNAQLFGSSLAAEADQLAFVDAALRGAGADRRLLLLIHKPIAASAEELATAPRYRFVPEPTRQHLWSRVRDAGVEAVISGHVHQSRWLEVAGMTQLWAPTTWSVLPDSMQATVGTKRCGILQLELPEVGQARHQFVEPDGMAQLTLSEEVP